jgi:phage terminase large subunit-like protein
LTTSTRLSDVEYAEQVREHYGLTCLPRWGTRRDFDAPTYGGRSAKVAKALGTPYTPWQRYAADIGLEVDPDTGLLAYRGVDITVPRQHGKTTTVLSVSVWRANAWRRQRILYGAQTGVAAREKWEDEHTPILEAAKAFRGRFRVRKANGREAFIWPKTGSIHGLTTNKEMSSHGKVLDLAMLDEYFAQVDYRLDQATGPAMITRPNAQKWRLSTAGTSKSVPFNAMRTRGRAAVESGRRSKIAFLDWCALPGMPRDDPATWRTCMPMLCPDPVRGVCRCSPDWRHTITEDAVWAELEALADEPDEFDRAYLNISREIGEVDADPNVPTLQEWELLADEDAIGGTVVAIGVDITPKRSHAAIVAAGFTPAGLPRLVVLEHGEGTGWVLESIKRWNVKLRPVAWALDEKSPAATLVLPMDRAGIPRMHDREPQRGHLWIPTVPQLGAASGDLTDLVRQGQLVHLGQAELAIAVDGAKTRPLGDGIWTWARKIAAADICPLVAATLALAALQRWQDLAKPRAVAAAASAPPAEGGGLYRPGGRLSI